MHLVSRTRRAAKRGRLYERRCLVLLLRIRSAYLKILGFPMGGVY